MAECNVQGCQTDATRRLVIAMETREWTPKICIETCKRHGDELDESGGRYLVTDSAPNGWSGTPDKV